MEISNAAGLSSDPLFEALMLSSIAGVLAFAVILWIALNEDNDKL